MASCPGKILLCSNSGTRWSFTIRAYKILDAAYKRLRQNILTGDGIFVSNMQRLSEKHNVLIAVLQTTSCSASRCLPMHVYPDWIVSHYRKEAGVRLLLLVLNIITCVLIGLFLRVFFFYLDSFFSLP